MKPKTGWALNYSVKCKCGYEGLSKYKNSCIRCYRINWLKNNPSYSLYYSKYSSNYRKNIIHLSKTIKRDVCPKCGKWGRWRYHYFLNKKTKKVSSLYIGVEHFINQFKKRKYVGTCYLGLVEGKKIC